MNTNFRVDPVENSGEQRNIRKGSPVLSGRNVPNRKRVPFLQPTFDNSFRPSPPFFGQRNSFVQMVNTFPGQNLQSGTVLSIRPKSQSVNRPVCPRK